MFLLINITGCKTEMKCKSAWSGDMQIDGVRNDWQDIPSTILNNKKVGFAFANDKKNLYAVLFFNEPFWAMGIKKKGLDIWYDTKLKNAKNVGFTFCGGPELDDVLDNKKNIHEKIKGEIPSEIQNHVVFHDDKELDRRVVLDELINLDIAFNSDRDLFIYEFAIPMQEIFTESFSYDSKTETRLQICLEWGNKKNNENKGEFMNNPEGFGKGKMGGSPPEGAMPGGQRRTPPGGLDNKSPQKEQIPDAQEVWIELQLAQKP